MGWTPHSQAELQAAGVQFGVPDTVTNSKPVIVYPNAYGVTDTSNPGSAPISFTTGVSANQLSDIAGSLGSSLGTLGNNLANQISSLGNSFNSGIDGLQKLIMENTDKNNAWSAAQAQRQMDFQERMQGVAQEFNAGEAAKNRNWQEMMSNTAHQREVADLKAAGLNPILSASGGNGAAVGSGAAANVGVPIGAQGNGDQSGNSALVAIYSALINAQTQMQNANLSAQTNLRMAEMQREAQMYGSALAAEASMQNAATAAEASRYAAGTNYAAAQYSADNQYRMQQAQLDFNDAHPSTMWQTAGSAGLVKDVQNSYQGFMSDARKAVRSLFGLSVGPSGKSVSSRYS